MFSDRTAAGKRLAETLARFRGTDAVVLALPRGGVPVAYEVAHALKLPLDILAVRKVGHPASPEYAIGAVDERGAALFNEDEASGVDPSWLKREVEREKKEARRRALVYRAGGAPWDVAGRTVILVDDGIATGLTMRAAARAAKKAGAREVVVASPVASAEAIAALEADGAEVVALESPEEFLGAIGSHYADFPQLADDEVIRLMRDAHRGIR